MNSKEQERLTEETAETRNILNKCVPLWSDAPENKAVIDLINYIRGCEPNTCSLIMYSHLFNLGFIEGVRAERARRRGETTPKMFVAATISHKKYKKYKRNAAEKESSQHTTE